MHFAVAESEDSRKGCKPPTVLPQAGLDVSVLRIMPRMMMRSNPVSEPEPMASNGSMATTVVSAAPPVPACVRGSSGGRPQARERPQWPYGGGRPFICCASGIALKNNVILQLTGSLPGIELAACQFPVSDSGGNCAG